MDDHFNQLEQKIRTLLEAYQALQQENHSLLKGQNQLKLVNERLLNQNKQASEKIKAMIAQFKTFAS